MAGGWTLEMKDLCDLRKIPLEKRVDGRGLKGKVGQCSLGGEGAGRDWML